MICEWSDADPSISRSSRSAADSPRRGCRILRLQRKRPAKKSDRPSKIMITTISEALYTRWRSPRIAPGSRSIRSASAAGCRVSNGRGAQSNVIGVALIVHVAIVYAARAYNTNRSSPSRRVTVRGPGIRAGDGVFSRDAGPVLNADLETRTFAFGQMWRSFSIADDGTPDRRSRDQALFAQQDLQQRAARAGSTPDFANTSAKAGTASPACSNARSMTARACSSSCFSTSL